MRAPLRASSTAKLQLTPTSSTTLWGRVQAPWGSCAGPGATVWGSSLTALGTLLPHWCPGPCGGHKVQVAENMSGHRDHTSAPARGAGGPLWTSE